MLRTCNVLRIAGVPVLRNDGQGFALPCSGAMRRNCLPAHGAGRAGLKPAPT
ncbi:MAG: hypothetical protein LBM98_12080 [Oscillospiraceae bacterium]|nr:hypothetical protein [Oscillospiraceae bacterium]